MNKKIKALSLLLSVTMLIGAMAGCGKKKDEVEYDENGRMTITWLGIPWNSALREEYAYGKKLIEEKFDVNIKMVTLDQDGYAQKKPVMLAGGEIPDIIYEMDPEDLATDVKQGFLMELPYEKIKEKCPDIYAELNEEVPAAWMYARYEGKNYGIPNIGYTGYANAVGIWRKDWLDAVGISKVPETIDELYDALYKFTYDDPDGNGKQDTYGMSGDIKNWQTTFDDIFGAYGVLPFDWMEKDGKVVYGGKEEAVKEVLVLLSQWYKEGIIDPEFITDSVYGNGFTKFQNGGVGYINNRGLAKDLTDKPDSLMSLMKEINPKAEIVHSLPVTGPDGERGTFAWGKGAHVNAFGKQLADQPEKLDKILEIFEYISTDQEFAVALRMGEQGVHYDFVDPSLGWEGGITSLMPDGAEKEGSGLSLSAGGQAFFSPITVKLETLNKMKTTREKEWEATYYVDGLGKTDVFMKADVLPSASKYFLKLRDKQMQTIADIIRGNKPIEEYDNFLNIWDKEGGKILEEEAQKTFEDRNEVYKLLGVTK